MSNLNPTVELWDIDKIKPYAGNAKQHPDDQIEKLATSIKTYGWSSPISVDTDGVVIAGHGRRLAAIKLGLKKVPVIHRKDLTKAQADALRLADNRVVSNDYDMSMIQDELRRLMDEEIDLSTLGFDEKELAFSMADLGEIDDDFFVEDVAAAVEDQRTETKAAVERVDDTAAPVTDALGFKRLPIAQCRQLRDLITKMEAKTGKTGPDALIDFLSSAM